MCQSQRSEDLSWTVSLPDGAVLDVFDRMVFAIGMPEDEDVEGVALDGAADIPNNAGSSSSDTNPYHRCAEAPKEQDEEDVMILFLMRIFC